MSKLHAWLERLPIDARQFGVIALVCAALSVIPPVICLLLWEAEHWVPQVIVLSLTPLLAVVAKVAATLAFSKDHRWGRLAIVGLLLTASTVAVIAVARMTGVHVVG